MSSCRRLGRWPVLESRLKREGLALGQKREETCGGELKEEELIRWRKREQMGELHLMGWNGIFALGKGAFFAECSEKHLAKCFFG